MFETTKAYTIDFTYCPDTRKKMFDHQEAAKRNPVRRVPFTVINGVTYVDGKPLNIR